MLFGAHSGGLELRKRGSGSVALRGRFPYGKTAVLSDGGRSGRPRKEMIAPRAFAYRVDKPEEDIHLLVGHRYDKPLASRGAGTLDLVDGDDALTFTAELTPEVQETTWGQDFLRAFTAGLIMGISPGFRIPPARAVANAEEITEEAVRPEDGMHGAIIRTILAALLYELSLVTRPAYAEASAQVEERTWTPTLCTPPRVHFPHTRWR